jgi:Ca-activated chloride channel family protein
MARHSGLPWLFLISFMGGALAQSPEPYKISVDVNLVELHATVCDRKGRFVSDLAERDFDVYEDGVKQAVRLFKYEDVPVTVGLVIDHSGSMHSKIEEVIAAARTFVKSSQAADEMFVVNFNETVLSEMPGKFTNRPDQLALAISSSPTIGQTALYDAMVVARERLRTGSLDKKVLLVISDGGDNASRHKLTDVLKMAEQSTALVYTIGIFDKDDPDQNASVLRRLARETGGEAFFPQQLSETVAICERIARDIRHQYTIGYASSNLVQSHAYRSIRVNAHGAGTGKLIVRTRSGYIAGGDEPPSRAGEAK